MTNVILLSAMITCNILSHMLATSHTRGSADFSIMFKIFGFMTCIKLFLNLIEGC